VGLLLPLRQWKPSSLLLLLLLTTYCYYNLSYPPPSEVMMMMVVVVVNWWTTLLMMKRRSTLVQHIPSFHPSCGTRTAHPPDGNGMIAKTPYLPEGHRADRYIPIGS